MVDQRDLSRKIIMITGGTGSFGQCVAKELLKTDCREVRIFSRDEKKQWEMRRLNPQFKYLLGDVRDLPRLTEAMDGADFVFHAAAFKHVPACEEDPEEALKTNALGAYNACKAAKAAGVKVFIGLSTDKAVKPVNVMGMTKAIMERIICHQNRSDRCETVFACVRYGNVLGSRGSVVPLFLKQIRERQPLTITNGSMTRFVLTLGQAVGLVLYAMQNAKGGEIYVRKAPACTVNDLAIAVRRKWSPDGDGHPLREIGVRGGEKLHEVLINEYEMQRTTSHEEYFVVHPDYRPPSEAPVGLETGAEFTSQNTEQLADPDKIVEFLELMGEIES